MGSVRELTTVTADKLALQTTIICTFLMTLKFIWTNMYVGLKKAKAGARPTEDQMFFKDVPQGFTKVQDDADSLVS